MNKMNFLKNIKFGRPSVMQIIVIVVGILLAVGGFFFVRGLITCWTLTPLPGSVPSSCGTVTGGGDVFTLNDQGTPIASEATLPPPVNIPASDLPPAWDGASRITVLIIGLDYRDWLANEGPPRSDTMILLTIDPLTKTAGMLSIPRDMWVNIPGSGYSRINTAYASGEGNKLPGGGPELARKTVEQFIGVPIQYYAQVDFSTFASFIDEIGGIEIYNDEDLRLDPLGNGKDKIRITCCGMRHLGGERALAYVRFRKDKEGDIARSKRQQKVIIAIRNKVLSPENFPLMIGKAQTFYEQFSAGIKTNMPFDTAIRLGVLAKDIPVESIKQGAIDYTMVALDNTVLGGQDASVMKPLPDKIRELRDQIFTAGGAVNPLANQNDLPSLMQADGARVRILNGSFTAGLDTTTGNFLVNQGVGVTEIGPADQAYNGTVIVLYSPKLYTLKYLQAVFGVTESARIIFKPDPTSTVDVEVRLGNDWANNNTMQ
jgi:polyisoprenyl-teichoic acid--peptidoglycan teichoic acid transferase